MNFVIEKLKNHGNVLDKMVINYEPAMILIVINNLHIHKNCIQGEVKGTFHVF